MSTDRVFAEDDLEALRRKYFPRVPWGPAGPVRRRYRARAAEPGRSLEEALTALAKAEGFIGPGREAISGGPEACLGAFRDRNGQDTMVFGHGLDAVWCDFALGPVGEDGWQELIVRSEEAENLTALAHAVGAARFRRI